jgi:hypothetical protein
MRGGDGAGRLCIEITLVNDIHACLFLDYEQATSTLNRGVAVNSLGARITCWASPKYRMVPNTTTSWLSFVLYSHMTAIETALSPWTETISPSRMASGSAWCILDLAKKRQSHSKNLVRYHPHFVNREQLGPTGYTCPVAGGWWLVVHGLKKELSSEAESPEIQKHLRHRTVTLTFCVTFQG